MSSSQSVNEFNLDQPAKAQKGALLHYENSAGRIAATTSIDASVITLPATPLSAVTSATEGGYITVTVTVDDTMVIVTDTASTLLNVYFFDAGDWEIFMPGTDIDYYLVGIAPNYLRSARLTVTSSQPEVG